MSKEDLLKAMLELTNTETHNAVGTYGSVNVDDLMAAYDRLNKVPTYDDLLRENKRQKEIIDMFLDKVDRNKMLLNNPDILDVYLKIKGLSN